MNEEEKIREYVALHRLNYGLPCNLDRFLNDNQDVRMHVEKILSEEPWFENISNVIALVSRGITEKMHCRTCGKVLKVSSVKKGFEKYCSGRCKSMDRSRKESDSLSRRESEAIYEVNLNVPVSDDARSFFIVNGCKPSVDVQDKIKRFHGRDSKGQGLFNLLKEEKDVDAYLTMLVRVHPWMENKKRAYWFAKNGLYEGKRCKACGKLLTYDQARHSHEYCSEKCATNHSDVQDNYRRKCLAKYGVTNPMKTDEVKSRQQNAMLIKYGVENPSQVDEFKEKRRQTNLERFGSEYYLGSNDCREKTRATSLERYGVEHPMKSVAVQDRLKRAFVEKYGVDNPSKNEEVRRKIGENTRHARYQAILRRYSDKVVPLFSEEEYVRVQGTECMWRCVQCGTEFEDHRHGGHCAYRRGSWFPLCPVCYPPMSGTSHGEQEIAGFVKGIYDGAVFENCRNVIAPYELDVYLPEKRVAIEFDGLFWHSEAVGKDEHYHLMKTEKCLERGIRLVHVFEDEWKEKREIVEDRIRSILGIGQKSIFARKCVVRDIDSKTANEFLNANHLQGCCNSSIRYGLFHNDEIVAVMTFGKPRFNKNYDWELVRYASKIGCHIVGGASKLLACFRKEHSGSIVSYADRRYSDGHLYEKLGFVQVGVSKPSYCYVKGAQKLNRYACQKHKLPALLGDGYDEELSECDNMVANGWSQVHDCGNFIYVID